MSSNFTCKQISSTVGEYVFAASLFIPSLISLADHQNESEPHSQYIQQNNKSTFDNYRNPLTGELKGLDSFFEQTVSSFYSHLLSSQESLGKEFEKVLYENIWDLYES